MAMEMSSTDTGTPAGTISGENGEGQSRSIRTYTEEDVERRLRGQGKVLKSLQSELDQLRAEKDQMAKMQAEIDEKGKAEQGKYKELFEKERADRERDLAEKEQLVAWRADREKRDADELKKIDEINEKRIEVLPDDMREKFSKHRGRLNPKEFSELLTDMLEEQKQLDPNSIYNGQPSAPRKTTPEGEIQDRKNKIEELINKRRGA